MECKEWIDGMGYLKTMIKIKISDAETLASRGESIGTVKRMREESFYENQLQEIKPENLRKVLREYGAWDDQELENHDENLNRILWIAGCDVAERPEDYITV